MTAEKGLVAALPLDRRQEIVKVSCFIFHSTQYIGLGLFSFFLFRFHLTYVYMYVVLSRLYEWLVVGSTDLGGVRVLLWFPTYHASRVRIS